MKIQKTLGELTRLYRLKMGLTLPDLAKKSKISKGLLSRIENGKGNPCLTTLEKLAHALNITFEIR